jgi:hypothetical protein
MGQWISVESPYQEKLNFYGSLERNELKKLVKHLAVLSVAIKYNGNCVPDNETVKKSLTFLQEFCKKYRGDFDIQLLQENYDQDLNDKFYWIHNQGTMIRALDDIKYYYKFNYNESEFFETVYKII